MVHRLIISDQPAAATLETNSLHTEHKNCVTGRHSRTQYEGAKTARSMPNFGSGQNDRRKHDESFLASGTVTRPFGITPCGIYPKSSAGSTADCFARRLRPRRECKCEAVGCRWPSNIPLRYFRR